MHKSTRRWILGGALLSRALGFGLILSALSAPARAIHVMPEIDPGLATSAMALLGAGLLMIAGRRRGQ
jgi:hypothetical protein